MIQKLACSLILAAAPLSAVRRATTQEMGFAAEVLESADSNSDGKASYAELASAVSKLGDVDQNVAMSVLEQKFRDVDADSDGLLNVDEVANLISEFRDQLADERDFATEVLESADTNSDGKASYAELASVVSKLGGVDQNAAILFLEQKFRDVDEDADGLLNVNEVASLVSAFRDQLEEGSADEPAHDPADSLMEQIAHAYSYAVGEGSAGGHEMASLISAFRDQHAESTNEPARDPTDSFMENVAHEVEEQVMEGRDPKNILEDVAKSFNVKPEELMEVASKVMGAPKEELAYGLQQELREMMKTTD